MACRRVLCGSSVYVHRKWSSTLVGTAAGATVLFFAARVGAEPLFTGVGDSRVAVATEDRIMSNCGCGRDGECVSGKM
jgi:hypothetical protein